MILKQGHKYRAMPHDGKLIAYIYRGGRCYYTGPYSLAATQALKAAFPQYWTAIRDYGYAHPALVPFVNEDPMLIVSLVEVGKVRTATIWNAKYSHDDNGIVFPFVWSEVGSMDMNITSDNNNCIFICGATSLTDATATKNGYCTFGGTNALGVTVARSGLWTLNLLSQVGMTFATITKNEYVRIGGWNNTTHARDLWINYWNIYDTAGDPLVKLVPFLTSEGEVCFLDLVNLQLHHNVYIDPFTIAITDK